MPWRRISMPNDWALEHEEPLSHRLRHYECDGLEIIVQKLSGGIFLVYAPPLPGTGVKWRRITAFGGSLNWTDALAKAQRAAEEFYTREALGQ